jgi:hypothetical protein
MATVNFILRERFCLQQQQKDELLWSSVQVLALECLSGSLLNISKKIHHHLAYHTLIFQPQTCSLYLQVPKGQIKGFFIVQVEGAAIFRSLYFKVLPIN